LLIVCRNMIENEKIPAWLGMWWIHAIALILGVFLLLQNRAGYQRFIAGLSDRRQHA